MAYHVPDFNLVCDIYSGPPATRSLRLPDVPCNLALGRRVQQLYQSADSGSFGGAGPFLLVPALTDVRDQYQGLLHFELVEVPQGSGRWYQINLVDDVAKGFENEYRICALAKLAPNIAAGIGLPFWPIPMP